MVARGEVWSIKARRGTRTVVIISTQPFGPERDWLYALRLEDPGFVVETLLTARIPPPIDKIAVVTTLAVIHAGDLDERIGAVPEHALEQVDMALRAILGL